jgi:hypothetical protein
MKYKVSELEGALLDAAVAKADGLPVHPGPGRYVVAAPIDTVWAHQFHPSADWRDGGPIIRREGIAVYRVAHGWAAVLPGEFGGYGGDRDYIDVQPSFSGQRGETPLIAAMRAYTASVFGDEVELP